MFGQNRDELRRFFVTTWAKRRNGDPLQPLELLVAQVIEKHPEYQAQVEHPDALAQDFDTREGTTNPFLHMGMHITLNEQLEADRPCGMRALYQKITLGLGDAHAAEHRMMECLGLVLWEAQRAGRMPDEGAYLECIKKLAG
jgi:hypothetical protein